MLGVGPLEHDRDHDDEHDVGDSDGGRGVRVDLGAGDIIILPVSCSMSSCPRVSLFALECTVNLYDVLRSA